jgi:hypothetical protein
MFKVPENCRILTGPFGSLAEYGNNGAFKIVINNTSFFAIASDQRDWEHVSVSTKNRTPTWHEMCFIKNLFWHRTATVMQLHPSAAEYINNHPHCLHLWRPINQQIPTPPSILVGIK